LDLSCRAYVFELKLASLETRRLPRFREVPRYPAIRRDIAVVIDEAVTAAQVQECIAAVADHRLQTCRIFDVYRGEGIAPGRKSLALGLILQDLTRTLQDEEVDTMVSRIVAGLTQTLGASLRV
jgi:phenylalanyl-tRNA synthetase beta chain